MISLLNDIDWMCFFHFWWKNLDSRRRWNKSFQNVSQDTLAKEKTTSSLITLGVTKIGYLLQIFFFFSNWFLLNSTFFTALLPASPFAFNPLPRFKCSQFTQEFFSFSVSHVDQSMYGFFASDFIGIHFLILQCYTNNSILYVNN